MELAADHVAHVVVGIRGSIRDAEAAYLLNETGRAPSRTRSRSAAPGLRAPLVSTITRLGSTSTAWSSRVPRTPTSRVTRVPFAGSAKRGPFVGDLDGRRQQLGLVETIGEEAVTEEVLGGLGHLAVVIAVVGWKYLRVRPLPSRTFSSRRHSPSST